MAYTHTTYAQLRTQLALRLSDTANIFWPDTELKVLLTEALRTFGLLSGFWRGRGTFATIATTAFYDLPTQLPSLMGYTVTDRDLIQAVQFYLLESASSQSSWSGTEMFTLGDLTEAIERRRNQFLADTGIVLTRSVVNVSAPPIGRQQLVDTVIDVRRAVWLGASPLNYYTHLWREDERALTGFDTGWAVTPGAPYAWSILAPPPLQLQLAPPPSVSGQLELVTVDSGAALTPSTQATIVGLPDDLTPAVKWGALADLLGKDGVARDQVRAGFCEQRYQQYVQLARMMGFVVHTEINGVALLPCTLAEVDAAQPNWESVTGPPTDVAIEGANLIGLYPVPDGVYSVTADVIRRTPVPTADTDQIQIGREQLDAIIDYAEHLALFKVGGSEWQATLRQANNFLLQAITYNQRLGAAARYVIAAKDASQREKSERPRRLGSNGLGALPSDPQEVSRAGS